MKQSIILLLCIIVSGAFSQNKPKLVLPVGHSNGITDLRFSPNGKLLASTSFDRNTKVWDVATGKLIHTLEGNRGEVSSVRFSDDGKMMITTAALAAQTWETASGKLLFTFDGHHGLVKNASLSKDGKFIVTASADSTAKVWSVSTGKILLTLKGHTGELSSAVISPDGKHILTPSADMTARLWDSQTGALVRTFTGHTKAVNAAAFSPDGKLMVTTSDDGMFKLWSTQTGKSVQSIDVKSNYASIQFTKNGKLVLLGGGKSDPKLIDLASGTVKFTFPRDSGQTGTAEFCSDESQIVTSSGFTAIVKVWSALTGKLIATLDQSNTYNRMASRPFVPVTFNPANISLIAHSVDGCPEIWDSKTSTVVHNFRGKQEDVFSASFNPQGSRIVLVPGWKSSLRIFDLESGKTQKINVRGWIKSAAYASDGQGAIVLSENPMDTTSFIFSHSLKIYDALPAGKIIDSTTLIFAEQPSVTLLSPDGKKVLISGHQDASPITYIKNIGGEESTGLLFEDKEVLLEKAAFSSDGKTVAGVYMNSKAHYLSNAISVLVWDVQTGKMKCSIPADVKDGHAYNIHSISFSPDGKRILTSSTFDGNEKIWDAATGKLIRTLPAQKEGDYTLYAFFTSYSPDGKTIISGNGNEVIFWDAENGNLLSRMPVKGILMDVNWKNKRLLSISQSTIALYDFNTKTELLSWTGFGEDDWVVTHPSGLFDVTPGALNKLYFTQDLDIIQFDQLKDRYYEPGLWKKVISGETLRNVVGFKSIDLPPDVLVGQVDDKGFLPITLTNRGGGIGEVNVFVNGKEIIKDAREENIKPDMPQVTLKVFIAKDKNLVKGQENFIGVKAWNSAHWVVSRGQLISYHTKEIEQYKPTIHILACGVSDYTGNEIDLKYAAKDATDMSVALQLGAKKLFGTERSYTYTLTTTSSKDLYPTKVNILKTFEKIASSVHPLDVFVVYLSGHGINYGGQDGDWHYLTQEAYTGSASAYNDPSIRQTTTLSSNELVELFKKVPALKQVLLIDACASGRVVDNLIAQKDIESSTLRALDRMRDRTGMHIITGCTADAVSYEASKYGQGVLTYSLLEGIRGAALREDQYVDVNKLFQYAQERVPQLAEGIGGIQSPQVFSPQGSQSFDIGLLSEAEKKAIPIAKIRPVYIRSNFQDEMELEDVLGIGKAVDESLSEVSSKGVESPIIFVDVRDYPEGCKLIGRYKKEGNKIVLKLRKKCGGEDKTYDISGADVMEIRNQVIKLL